nr:hypothetical protein Iba_chr02dCG17220 [Ipomoea batatas]
MPRSFSTVCGHWDRASVEVNDFLETTYQKWLKDVPSFQRPHLSSQYGICATQADDGHKMEQSGDSQGALLIFLHLPPVVRLLLPGTAYAN